MVNMRILTVFWLIPLSLAFGCTTTSPKYELPPYAYAPLNIESNHTSEVELAHQQLETELANDSRQSNFWWVRYNQARLWQNSHPQKACNYYHQLSKEEDFPLRELALIRTHQYCPVDTPDLAELDFEKLKSKKWLRDTLLETSLQTSQKRGDFNREMDIYVEKSKISIIRHEKVDLMKKAISLAKKNNLDDKLENLEKRLYFLAPRLNPQGKDQLQIAYDLRRARLFPQARRIYYKIIANKRSSVDDIYKALHGIRRSFKLERNTEKYLRATKNLAMFTYRTFHKHRRNKRLKEKYAKLYHDTMLLYVRTLWTDGQVTAATKLLKDLPRDLQRLVGYQGIYWLRGRIAEENKDYRQALSWFDRALQECQSNCSLEKNLIWYKAWILHKTKKHQAAAKELETLVSKVEDHEKPKYLFWLGKQLVELGQNLEARSKFSQLIDNDPVGYYGILAHRELNIPFSTSSKTRTIASQAATSFNHSKEGIFASWLISVGEKDLAGKYLKQQVRKMHRKKVKEIHQWREIFTLFARNRSYNSLFYNLTRLPTEIRKELISLQPQMIFPQPYQDAVLKASKQFGVIPELIYSIMRQESAFNRQARSPADAFGLMQLIPSVAKKTASSVGIPFSNHEDLFHPETNISLGSAHLKKLWDRYQGQFVLLAASYNASEKAIHGWLQHRYEGDTLQFIEDIPYKETQNYIKLVLRNLVFYQSLSSDDRSIPFPEWCLENIQNVKI